MGFNPVNLGILKSCLGFYKTADLVLMRSTYVTQMVELSIKINKAVSQRRTLLPHSANAESRNLKSIKFCIDAGRSSAKEYVDFISIAKESLSEVEIQIQIAQMLNYTNATQNITATVSQVGRLLTGLQKKW